MPEERELSAQEREEIQDAAVAAIDTLGVEAHDAATLVRAIEERILARRMVPSEHNEEVFQLGALFAHCLEEALGWEIVELSWEALQAPAVVAMDRSLVVLPFLAVAQLFDQPNAPAELASSFDRLLDGDRPPGLERNGFAVLLP